MSNVQALFQLGMDLDPDSSTAQGAPVTGARAPVTDARAPATGAPATEERRDFYIERDGVRYAGMHLIVDLWEAERLDDLAHVEAALRVCVEAAGATLLHIHLHHFTPHHGISGVAVLAESHISIHTWPETGYAALDVFMCGCAEPYEAIEVLRKAFRPARLAVEEILRGRVW
jgi:S-adenosylmethionine decarboxylase